MDHLLTPWEKIAIIFVGGSIAGLTLLVVVCLVCPTCFFYRILNKSKYLCNCFIFVSFSFTLQQQGRQKVKKSGSTQFPRSIDESCLVFHSIKIWKGVEGPHSRPDPPKNVKKPQTWCDCHWCGLFYFCLFIETYVVQ